MGYVTNAKGQTTYETSPGNKVLKDSVFDPASKNYNATVANSGGRIALGDLDSGSSNGLSATYNSGNGVNSVSQIAARDKAERVSQALIMSANTGGGERSGISNVQSLPTSLVNQTTIDQAAQIKLAKAVAQAGALNTLKTTSDNQLQATINPYKTAQAAIPGQVTTLNNQASSTGMVNAQKIREALNQMGLLQSGESASQQLLNDTSTANNINANNLQGQQLDASYNDKIALATAQNATDYNKQAYQYGRDATADDQWGQTFEYGKIQDAIRNAQNQQQIDNQASQFAQSFGLSQQQFANTINQQGIQNAMQDKQFVQNANQFAQQMGLSTAQYVSGLDQWAKTFAQNEAQNTFNNGINVGQLTGIYNGSDTLAKQAQAIQDAQFNKSLTADTNYKNASLAASQAKASSGGSYYGGATNATVGKQNATADAYQAIDDAFNSGQDPDIILKNIQNSYPKFARDGVDPEKALGYFNQRRAQYLGLETTPGQL